MAGVLSTAPSTAEAIEASLVKAANVAQLLPRFPELPKFMRSNRCHLPRVISFYLTVTSSSHGGLVLPELQETWIAIKAFETFNADAVVVPKHAYIDPTSAFAVLLRRRMRFLELFARVAMTAECDWRTSHLDIQKPTDQTALHFNWRNVLCELTGNTWASRTTEQALATLRFGHPKFLIQLCSDSIPDNFPEMLETFLMGITNDNDDAGLPLDDALRDLVVREEKKSWGPTRRVVELGLAMRCGRLTTPVLFRIFEVLKRFSEYQKQRQATAKIEFRVTALMLTEHCTITGSALEHLGQLVRRSENLHIEEVKIVEVEIDDELSLQRCISNLVIPAEAPIGQPTKTLRFYVERESKLLVGAAAAVRYNTYVRDIAMTHTAEDMDGVAAWLAFGFFHVDSASTVETLRLQMPGYVDFPDRVAACGVCSTRFVEIFWRVLSRVVSPRYLAPLDQKIAKNVKRKRGDQQTDSPLDELPLSRSQRVLVSVKANTKARKQPLTSSPVIATLAESTQVVIVTQFQVLRQLRAWVAVVVPGFGAGWIPRTCVVSEFTQPTRVTSTLQTNGRVKSFEWVGGAMPAETEIQQQHAASLMTLLALVGRQLDVLRLPRMALSKRHVASIVQHCPRLKELSLFGNSITDISPLVTAYEQGTCQISSLNVAQHAVAHDRVARQCTTIIKLCNQDTNASVKRPALEKLVLRLAPFQHHGAEIIPMVYKTILRDPKLEYVRIHCDGSESRHLIAEMERMQNEAEASARATAGPSADLAISTKLRSRPLPVACKLAFASVVCHSSTQNSALSGMDAGVLAIIFDLACTGQPRVVRIEAH